MSLLWLCLKAIELNGDHHISFEVILVDDFSEKNKDFYDSLAGVKIINNKKNLGFFEIL